MKRDLSDELTPDLEFTYNVQIPIIMNFISILITIIITFLFYIYTSLSLAFFPLTILIITTISTSIMSWPYYRSHLIKKNGVFLRFGMLARMDLTFEEIEDVSIIEEKVFFPRPKWKDDTFYMISTRSNFLKIKLRTPKPIWKVGKGAKAVIISLDDPDMFIMQYNIRKEKYIKKLKGQ